MKTVSTHEAKTHLSRLLREVQNGEEVVILNGREPVGKLIPYTVSKRKRPKVGTVTSPDTWVAKNAFRPLTDKELAEWGL
jgi:prevent-host-death family protein